MNENLYLEYKGKKIKSNIPATCLKNEKFLKGLFSAKNLTKILTLKTNKEKIKKLLPMELKEIVNNPEEFSNLITSTKTKFFTPLEKFKLMYDSKFFSKIYQTKLPYIKESNLIDFINKKEKIRKYFEDKLLDYKEYKEDENNNMINNNLNSNILTFDMHSDLRSSGYTSIDSDTEKKNNLNKNKQESLNNNSLNNTTNIKSPENKDLNQKNNKISKTSNLEDFKESKYQRDLSENEEDSFIDRNILLSERFKNLKKNKNQITIKPRTQEEINDYRIQEENRYKNPLVPWEYKLSNGNVAIVAPLFNNNKSIVTKARDHALLKNERPPYITLLSLVRDAAAKLQDGVGTRLDICLLLKESQYIIENVPDYQLNNIVSGALDRLHYQKDPCVKYDLKYKLWIYLHRNRSLDFPGWKNTTENENINLNDIKIIENSNNENNENNENNDNEKINQALSKKRERENL